MPPPGILPPKPKGPKYSVDGGNVVNRRGGHFDAGSGNYITGKGKSLAPTSKKATRFTKGAQAQGYPTPATAPYTQQQYDQFFGVAASPGGQTKLSDLAKGQSSAPPPVGGTASIPPVTPPPPAPTTPPNFSDIMNSQFGVGNPFDASKPDAAWGAYADALRDRSNYNLQKNLGGIRERSAASGLGHDARGALAEGAATGEAQSALDATLAGAGLQDLEQLRSLDMQGILGAGQLNLGQEQMSLSALNQLSNQGAGLLGSEESDRSHQDQIMQMIQQILANFSTQTGDTTGYNIGG
jgi:hypothetical protein